MSDTLPHENENRANEDTVRKDFWPKLKANLARLPFAEDLVAARYAAFDSRTPLKVRGTLFGALAYFILPIDVVPDFILGLGFTDDLAVLMTAVTLLSSHITPEHRDKARDTLARLRAGSQPGTAD